MSESWYITLLGGLRAQREEQVITRFKYQKVGGLLAYLAYYPRQMHSRDVLVDIFWPESESGVARNNLSTALSSLRNQFEPPGTPAGTVLRADRYSVGLNPAMVKTDVAEFETAAREAEKTNRPTERRQSLERAIGLYQGRLLAGYYEAWIVPEEVRLAGLFFDTINALILHLEQQGDLTAALRCARQAVSMDSLREEAHQHLMRLLTAAGQPGAALRQYKELERLLEEEIGEEPSASLRALARQIEKQSGLTTSVLPVTVVSPVPAASPLIPPTGQPTTLTFLLTDIESATEAWEQTKDACKAALTTHHATLRVQFAAYGGQEIKEIDTAFLVAFTSARKALLCAVACQQALSEQLWPEETGALLVRMALHTGDVEFTDGDYRGSALHQASRIVTAAHGGQILVSQATAELVRRDLSETVRLVDLGVYRLRDMQAPERLHQVEYPGMLLEGFPAPAAEAGLQTHLPVQITRFFGREQEIARLEEMLSPHSQPLSKTERGEEDSAPHLLTSSSPRLVTLTGPGGTGKTRLALAVAERLLSRYQGAVWFVSLADLTETSRIASAILDALHLPRSPRQEPVEQVVQALSKQPSLLVLDNFEHLVEEGAAIARTLLTRVPSLALLVTSRRLLGLSGEREFLVPLLPTPNGNETPEQLSLFDSVRLFMDRAQAVMPHFQVTNHNAPAVAELCQRLEGIPLAIELAAARIQVLTPGQLLAQLTDRFGLLISRRRDVSERQRTIWGAMEWSYRLLFPELQRFFNRLSVFRGGWTAETAEAVCEEPLALDYLALLRECSLVLTEDSGTAMRFRMLETLREYAEAQLLPEEQIVLQRRHLDLFLALTEEAREQLNGAKQAHWLKALETEHDNLRAAISISHLRADWIELEVRLLTALGPFWDIRGYHSEGRERFTLLLSHPEVLKRGRIRAEALHGAALFVRKQADFRTALLYGEECIAIYRELEDRDKMAASLHNQGITASDQGDFVAARDFYEEALMLNRQLGNHVREASNLMVMGLLDWKQGYYGAARSLLEEALMLNRQLGNRLWEAGTLVNLGLVAWCQGEADRARALLEQALTIQRELEDRPNIAIILGNLGNIASFSGDLGAARILYEESLEIRRELGDGDGIASTLNNLGHLSFLQGDLAAARTLSAESLSLRWELGLRGEIVFSFFSIAKLAFHAERMERAARIWGAMERLREEIGLALPPEDIEEYDKERASVQQALGEQIYETARVEGATMTLEQAVTYALEV